MARATSVCMERCGTGQRRVRNVMCAWRRLRTRGCSDYANRRYSVWCKYLPIGTFLYNVLKLRSSKCSDLRYRRHTQSLPIRHPWLSGSLPERRVQALLMKYRTLTTSKFQTYHIVHVQIGRYMHLHIFAVCMNGGCRLCCSWPSKCAWGDGVGAKRAGKDGLLQTGK